MGEPQREILERAAAGDAAARDALMRDHLPALRAFVRLRLGPAVRAKEESLDLVQSVCREVLGDLGRFEYRGEGSFRRWLFLRAEHKIVDRGRFWRRDRRATEREVSLQAKPRGADPGDGELLDQLASFCTPSRHASAREELERIERAFDQLPPDYREVITLARLAGLPHEEVGRLMGRAPGASRTLLSRALARLATLLEER